jgi:hypothetical protein
VGLGNGIADPQGQGVDGLDFLENIQFADWRPAVGCVLGDEAVDAGSGRNFFRPDSPFNTGQGVFRLDPDFSDVPGVRLQQFNRSPQTGPVTWENNADFIEISIPLAELGNIVPGDTIRLAAVVGGGGFSTNALEQPRPLDSSFIGSALQETTPRKYELRPLEIKLAGANRLTAEWLHPGMVRLRWNAKPGRHYTIEMAANLGAAFANAAPALFPRIASSNEEYFDLDVGDASARYFRLVLLP